MCVIRLFMDDVQLFLALSFLLKALGEVAFPRLLCVETKFIHFFIWFFGHHSSMFCLTRLLGTLQFNLPVNV